MGVPLKIIRASLVLASLFVNGIAHAATANIAVAANFAAPVKEIAQTFESESGHQLTISVGSTGKLFSQIQNGAPFDVFLAADTETPGKAEEAGLSVPETRFTYAIGKLVLWSPDGGLVEDEASVLETDRFERIAMANPKVAPYGLATEQVIKKLDLVDTLSGKWVFGQSIGQTYQFIASGNVPLGFVALSQVFSRGKIQSGSAWIVPENIYTPLAQDAQLLKHGHNNAAATAFIAFLKSPTALAIIESFGYGLPER
ncbi:molybdate ABC transporter substrate-binding protein [Neopusillimonas maritima]|jgi:molybdate transport system substrate-binding protein|uniref:Molybdate ABC transporter substrate-binding protein n=1 Tax=Neopusillimonas maritima TaxID=2026239 RepID=A0A3A1YN10_9BURK|nr:molybdate ABC transporter substrate-binding protein [Neopusillimonas maritima]MBF24518.1 molybdate ABC transporter substrate-binding protein [Pusillimonas sp.]RIY39552.1 molybdate ABC transporter substrate-binding protein [Neopusillimonas maritima]|tara:strand:+ start:325 stop:1095 length:771 start_codon:yes stop_codon:yes gene_type:complete